jgi:hypothetical protein
MRYGFSAVPSPSNISERFVGVGEYLDLVISRGFEIALATLSLQILISVSVNG